MMLFKLSIKNIKKSFKDYAIYFFTLILGVAIFYVFNAIDSQTVLLDVTRDTRELIKLMTNMLSGVSVFVSFILGFLIIYASRFLMKRRNKEFGIYLTLGMSKRKISMILFFETFLIGLLSLVVGLGLGVLISQFMSLLVANMFEADLTEFAFTFSNSACVKTFVYFGIMYFLVMIFNTVNVSKCKLIDLLHGSKKSEKVKLKNPIFCTILFIISACMLGYAYYLVTVGFEELSNASDIFIPIILGTISTFLIFWSLSGLILTLVTRIKRFYYKALNSFTLRQISSKINTTVFSMSVICLMLFITICVLSSALSIKNSMTANLKTLVPIDVQFTKTRYLNDGQVEQNVVDDSKITIHETLKLLEFDMETNLKDVVELDLYDTGLTFKDTLGNYYNEASKKYPFMTFDTKEDFIKLSDYNRLARLYGLEEYTLESNEYIAVADYKELATIRNEALKRNVPIMIENEKYYPKYVECKNGFLFINSTHSNSGFFIVPDEALVNKAISISMMSANYKANDEIEKNKMEERIAVDLENHPYVNSTTLKGITKIKLYETSVGLGAMVTFIGLYLGIIFLMSSAAILALKELSESTDNKERFRVLRKIGTDEKMLHQALFRQIGIFFLFPLLIAIIHSIFGILFCNRLLAVFGDDELLPSIIMTAFFIVSIYGGYFLLTYFCSKNIIREKI